MEPLILVVDDDAAVRSLSVDILERSGYPVLEAANASAALLLLEKHPCVSLLFTDINMPIINGYVLADMAVMRWPHLHVLYTTGELTSPASGKPAKLLHGEMLTKPYRATQLTAAVAASLAAGRGQALRTVVEGTH